MGKKLKRIHPIKPDQEEEDEEEGSKKQKKRKEVEMDEGLRAIYGAEPEDLRVVTKGTSPLTRWLTRIIGFLAFAAVVVFGAIIISSNKGLFPGTFSPLELSVEVPHDVVSGEQVTIAIPYKNPENVPLAALEVNVNLPPSFVPTQMDPAPTDPKDLIFSLGSINPRGEGVIRISGVWTVPVPSTNTIQAIANYRPANFSSDFSKIASASVVSTESVLALDVTGPEKATPGANVTYTLKATNTGGSALGKTTLTFVPPEGFTVSSANPAFTSGERPLWMFEKFEAGSEKIVTVTGSFASDVTDTRKITATVSLAASGISGETKTIAQATDSVDTDVSGGALRISLVGNGLTGEVTAAPGETLRLGFRLENVGQTPMTDASVVLDFQPETGIPILWSKSNLDKGVMKKEGIVFDTKTLGVLNPNDKKSFNLAFPLKPEILAPDVDTFTVVARATVGGVSIQSSPLTVRVTAAVGFTATAHYYSTDGAPIGEGPLPPVVGTGTTFEVMWTITHALHSLEDLVVTATLPPGVTFAGNAASDMGKVSYDRSANIVRFDVADVPKDAGPIHAKFYVTATPQAADLGKTMRILSGSALRVTDTVTGTRIEKDAESLTTALPDDKFAEGKGIVIGQ